MPYFETADGTALYYADWGEGAPIAFGHSWGSAPTCGVPGARGRRRLPVRRLRSQGPRMLRPIRPRVGLLHAGRRPRRAVRAPRPHEVALLRHLLGCEEIVCYVTPNGRDRVAQVVLPGPIPPFLLKTTTPGGGDRRHLCDPGMNVTRFRCAGSQRTVDVAGAGDIQARRRGSTGRRHPGCSRLAPV